MTRLFALAVLMFALMVPAALVQAQDRGYGGPATVGPNFSTGKQSAPPDYGVGKPKKKSPSATSGYKKSPHSKKYPTKTAKPKSAPKPSNKVAKPSKPKPSKNTVAKAKPNKEETEDKTENADDTADVANTTADAAGSCRKFIPETGTTIEVACE